MSPISVYEHNVVVLPPDIDENRHANNVCYLRWMNAAALEHSAANGWLPQRYIEFGATWFARKHTIEYLAPCYEGEKITVETWIDDWQQIRSTRKYRFLRKKDGVTVAQAETLWVFVNLTTGRPTRIPPIVTDSFTVYKTHTSELQQG